METVEKKSLEINLDALRSGDKAEFSRLVEATSGNIFRLAMKMLNDQRDAEDVLQETYLKAMRYLPTFEGRSSLSTWLYRIAVNEALMALRKHRPTIPVEDELSEDDGEIEQPVQLVDFCCLPESELAGKETKRLLTEAIQRLSPGLRAVFLLRDVEGFSIKETSEVLNLTEMNVKIRLLRARLKLREELSHYFSERLKGDRSNG